MRRFSSAINLPLIFPAYIAERYDEDARVAWRNEVAESAG